MLKHPLLYVAVVLIAAGFAAGLIRPASERSTGADNHTAGTQGQQDAARSTPAAVGEQEQRQAQIYNPDCKNPKDHTDADFCSQRRMANAAEQQNLLNAWALGAVIATLLATGAAALAAWQTVSTMRHTAERQLRAYLGMSEGVIENFAVNTRPRVRLVVKNFGQTPAKRFRYWAEMQFAPTGTTNFAMPGDIHPVSPRVLNPQEVNDRKRRCAHRGANGPDH